MPGIGTSTQVALNSKPTKPTGRIGTSMWPHNTTRQRQPKQKPQRNIHHQSYSCSHRKPPGMILRQQGPIRKQSALHQEDHRHAGPFVIVQLQHHTPSDKVKPPALEPSQADHDNTTRGGLTMLAVRLHLALVALKKHYTRGTSPRPLQYSMSRICLYYRHQNGGQSYPASKVPIE